MKIAIIPLPDDSFPSRKQFSVQKLCEDIFRGSMHDVVVYAVQTTSADRRITGFNKSVRNPWYGRLSYRLNNFFFGTNDLGWIPYYKWAYRQAFEDQVDMILQEEYPAFLRYKRHAIPLIMHLHSVPCIRSLRKYGNRLSKCVFVSKARESDTLKQFKSIDTATVFNGIDLKDTVDTPPRISNKLLFLGRVIRTKGVLEAAQAIGILRANGFDVTLDFAGPGDESFIAEVNKYPDVNYLGLLEKDELPEVIAEAGALIVPSIGEEGLPLCIFEAFVFGTPVIASDRGGTLEVLDDGVNGINIGRSVTAESIVSAVRRFYSVETEIREHMLNHIGDYRERFSSQRMVAEFDQLFTEVYG